MLHLVQVRFLCSESKTFSQIRSPSRLKDKLQRYRSIFTESPISLTGRASPVRISNTFFYIDTACALRIHLEGHNVVVRINGFFSHKIVHALVSYLTLPYVIQNEWQAICRTCITQADKYFCDYQVYKCKYACL